MKSLLPGIEVDVFNTTTPEAGASRFLRPAWSREQAEKQSRLGIEKKNLKTQS